MAIIEIRVPAIAESVTEVTLSKWHIQNETYITKDQHLCDIESDKAMLELPAECSGLISFAVFEGAELKIGDLIAKIDTNNKTIENSILKNEQTIVIDNSRNIVIDTVLNDSNDIARIKEDFANKTILYYERIIENLQVVIGEQEKLIKNMLQEKEKHQILQEKLTILKQKLRIGLNINFDSDNIDDLHIQIINQFEKIEAFDLYLREKKTLLEKWMSMLAKGLTKDVIKEILNYSKEKKNKDLLSNITSISNSWNSLNKKENNGTIDHEYSDKARNKINQALISILHEFNDNFE